MQTEPKTGFVRILASFMDNFGLSRAASILSMIVIGLIILFACFWFFHSAPPKTITITCGDKGSLYYKCRREVRQKSSPETA